MGLRNFGLNGLDFSDILNNSCKHAAKPSGFLPFVQFEMFFYSLIASSLSTELTRTIAFAKSIGNRAGDYRSGFLIQKYQLPKPEKIQSNNLK